MRYCRCAPALLLSTFVLGQGIALVNKRLQVVSDTAENIECLAEEGLEKERVKCLQEGVSEC